MVEMVVGDLASNNYGAQEPVPGQSRLVGIEIEIEGVGISHATFSKVLNNASAWATTADHSLRDGGIEFVSSPMPYAKIDPQIELLYEGWKIHKWTASHRTGIHVHVDARDYGLEDLRAFFTLYSLLEPALFEFVGKEREECTYCVPWYRARNEIPVIVSSLNGGLPSFLLGAVGALSKYSALYTEPLRRFGTMEFRHAPTWKDADKVIRWTKACASLVDYARGRTAKDIFNKWSSYPLGTATAALGKWIPVSSGYESETIRLDCDYLALCLAGLDVDERDWQRVESSLPKEAKSKKISNKSVFPSGLADYLINSGMAQGTTSAASAHPDELTVLLDDYDEDEDEDYYEDNDDDEEYA